MPATEAAAHEAGHGILFLLHGVGVAEVVVRPDGTSGFVLSSGRSTFWADADGCACCAAGGWAGERLLGHAGVVSASDRRWLGCRLGRRPGDPADDVALAEMVEAGKGHALAKLRRHAEALHDLAAELDRCGRMTGERFGRLALSHPSVYSEWNWRAPCWPE